MARALRIVQIAGLACGLFFMVAPGSGQEPRTPLPNDSYYQTHVIFAQTLGPVTYAQDVSAANHELDDFTLTCVGEGIYGFNTVFFSVIAAAGSIEISTETSTYDTVVVALYDDRYWCSDDDVNTQTSRLRIPVVVGGIWMMVASKTELTAPNATLHLAISYEPFAQYQPDNDYQSTAKKVSLPFYETISGAPYATTEVGEPVHTCRVNPHTGEPEPGPGSHSIWYKFKVAHTTEMLISTAGSRIGYLDDYPVPHVPANDTVLSLYQKVGNAFVVRACAERSIDPNVSPDSAELLPPFGLPAGKYLLHVSASRQNMLADFLSSLQVRLIPYYMYVGSDLLFGEAGSTAWIVKRATDDGVVCGPTDCHFRFTGSEDENSKLIQHLQVANPTPAIGQQLYITADCALYHTELGPVDYNATAQIKITYGDGTAPTIAQQPLIPMCADSPYFSIAARFASNNISGIKVSVTNRSSARALIFLDNFQMRIDFVPQGSEPVPVMSTLLPVPQPKFRR
ncbi:MAG: hypothetical protein IPM16_21780 [Chloroflexi bacterium]|nr:hypothetical protein [Chloroflexota bacterium]